MGLLAVLFVFKLATSCFSLQCEHQKICGTITVKDTQTHTRHPLVPHTKSKQFTEHVLIRLGHGRMYLVLRRIEKRKMSKLIYIDANILLNVTCVYLYAQNGVWSAECGSVFVIFCLTTTRSKAFWCCSTPITPPSPLFPFSVGFCTIQHPFSILHIIIYLFYNFVGVCVCAPHPSHTHPSHSYAFSRPVTVLCWRNKDDARNKISEIKGKQSSTAIARLQIHPSRYENDDWNTLGKYSLFFFSAQKNFHLRLGMHSSHDDVSVSHQSDSMENLLYDPWAPEEFMLQFVCLFVRSLYHALRSQCSLASAPTINFSVTASLINATIKSYHCQSDAVVANIWLSRLVCSDTWNMIVEHGQTVHDNSFGNKKNPLVTCRRYNCRSNNNEIFPFFFLSHALSFAFAFNVVAVFFFLFVPSPPR